MNKITTGLLTMVFATVVLACMHGMVRFLGESMHPVMIVFFRNLFGLIAISPLVIRGGRHSLRTSHLRLLFIRSSIGLIAMVTWFYGLVYVPTAEATALSFTAAIFASLIAFLFLGEKMRIRRWLAILTGFIGVLILLRPSTANFNPYMLTILLSCVFWGISVNIVKHLSNTDSSTSIVAWMSIFLTALSLPLAMLNWETPNSNQLLILAVMGVLGTLGHLGMAKALSLADTTPVMSIDFFRLVWSAMIGIYFFGDSISVTTWIGALIIFSSGIYIIFRESSIK